MISCTFEDMGKASLRHVTVNALVLKSGKILLEKRAERLTNGGKWGLVGGFVDRNETLIESIKRELFEETGYLAKSVQFLAVIDNPKRRGEDRQNICFVFVCGVGEKEGNPDDESTAIEWFDLNHLPSEEEMAFDHHEIINMYLKHKDKSFVTPLFKSK